MSALRVAILQPPAPDFSRAGEGWAELLTRIDDAAQDGPHLVVLPEASYPAWFLGHAASSEPEISDEQLLADLGARARRHGLHIAAGLILGRPDTPHNAAVLIGPDGAEIAHAAESQPAPWFRPGGGPAVAMVRGTPVTLVAGNDHLDPRWVEAIVEARTELIIATGSARGWSEHTVGDRHGQTINTDPVEAILTTRSLETGAWVAAAGRTGIEGDAVGYTGGAGIVVPGVGWVVRAPADRVGIVLYECEPTPPQPGAPVTPAVSPATSQSPAPSVPGSVHVAALALDPSPSAVDLMEAMRASVRAAATLGARIVVLPDLTGADPRAITSQETLPLIQAVSQEAHTIVISASAERTVDATYRAVIVVEDGAILAVHRQSALSLEDQAAGFVAGDAAPPIVDTRAAGRIGVIGGREALAPPAAARLRQQGAGLIAWCAGRSDHLLGAVAQTRAWEQQTPVVAAGPTASGAAITGERGELLAITRRDSAMLTHALVRLRAQR